MHIDVFYDVGNANTVIMVARESFQLKVLSSDEVNKTVTYPTVVYCDELGEKFFVPDTRSSRAGCSAVTEGWNGDPSEGEGSESCHFRLHGFKPLIGLTCKADVQDDITEYLREHGIVIEDRKGGGLIMQVGPLEGAELIILV